MDPQAYERWWRERGERELRELLLREWDPIGIDAIADSQLDEYEHYAGVIARRLRAGAGEEEVARVLDGFRTDMGLEAGDEPPLRAARSIVEWYRRAIAPRSE